MQNNLLFNKIYKIHFKKLKNLNVLHKKLIICFSGIAGSGKTYIAKILEEKYKGVRIRTDDIREIVGRLMKKFKLNAEDKDPIVYGYVGWLLKNNKFKNKLIILDKGIDREYKEIFKFSKEKGYKLFIIRLVASRKVLDKRVFGRSGGIDEHYYNEINRWTNEWKKFGKKIKSDIIIKNDKDNKLNLTPLFKKLDKLIIPTS